MKGFLVFILCLVSFIAGGWVAGPWLVDQAVDHFIARLNSDPQLAGRVVTALINNPAFRTALGAEFKKRGIDIDKIDVKQLQGALQGLIGVVSNPEFQQRILQAFPAGRPSAAPRRLSGDNGVEQGVDQVLQQLQQHLAGVTDPKTMNQIRGEIDRRVHAMHSGSQ